MAALQTTDSPPAMQVDFSWRKFKARITEKPAPGAEPGSGKPLYILDYRTFKTPSLLFQDVSNKDETFATGTLHAFNIHADCELRGQAIKIQPLSRLRTAYMHLSRNFSDNGEPVEMRWGSATDFKTWDFICTDANDLPVAKFAANIWAARKVGSIEFLGSHALTSAAAREEIAVVGLTMYCEMLLRMNNIFNLFGAMVTRPSKGIKELQREAENEGGLKSKQLDMEGPSTTTGVEKTAA
jgi:hypothetical protein